MRDSYFCFMINNMPHATDVSSFVSTWILFIFGDDFLRSPGVRTLNFTGLPTYDFNINRINPKTRLFLTMGLFLLSHRQTSKNTI